MRPSGVKRTAVMYVTMFLATAVSLIAILVHGNTLQSVPEVARSLDTTSLADCLGTRLTAVQSGAFVDLHVPSASGSDAVEGELGDRVLRGRIDAAGTGRLDGNCLDGSVLRLDVRVQDDGGLDAVVGGAAGTPISFAPGDAADVPATAAAEPLEGGELIARMFLAVAVIMAAARLVGAAFAMIRQPQVIGEIVAGILLGPSLLGFVAPEVADYLFPPGVVDVLIVMAQFGLILFMFLIGLELDLSLIRGSGHTAVFVSHVSIVAPLVLGAALAIPIYPLVGSGSFSAFALFMGAAMAITAFPVLARILTDSGLHNTRLGTLAISCAAVDDVTAWCVLAVVVSIAKATGAAGALATIGLAVVFIAAMIGLIRPLLRRLEWVHAQRGRLGAQLTAALLVGLLLSAWATEVIGIHAIFGAFLAGAVLPRSGDLARELTGRLEDLTVLFLLPIFFAVVGLSTSIGLLDQPVHWFIAAAVLATAVAGKWGAGTAAARLAGEGWRESNALGILMNTRGLAEIVILTVGRELGVISPALFTAMVLMALTTTLMTTPLLALFYPKRRFAEIEAAEPSPAETQPYRVMVAVGDLKSAENLVAIASKMRGPTGPPELLLVRVLELRGDEHLWSHPQTVTDEEDAVATQLAPLVADLRGAGVTAEAHVEVGSDPATTLAQIAEARKADVILLGMHRSLIFTRVFGGVVEGVLAAATCRVAIVVGPTGPARRPMELRPGPVIVVTGGPDEQAAIDVAERLARAADSTPHRITQAELPVATAHAVVIGYAEMTAAHAGLPRHELVGDDGPVVIAVRSAAAGRRRLLSRSGDVPATGERASQR